MIGLTHMSMKNDMLLCEKVPEIDVILGGHDHNYWLEQVGEGWETFTTHLSNV